MTSTQEIIWTALPYGRTEDGRLRLTAFVSPRLRTDDEPSQLGSFPDFVSWPAAVNGMTFTVMARTAGVEVPASRLSPPADAELWQALFTATSVRPFTFDDHSQRNIRSFPVDAVMTYLAGLYQGTAQSSPDDLPLIVPAEGEPPDGTLGGLVADLGRVLWHFRIPHGEGAQLRFRRQWLGELMERTGFRPDDEQDLLGSAKRWARERRFHALDAAFAGSRVVQPGMDPATFGFSSQEAMDFYQAHRFFDRPENASEYLPNPDSAKIPPPPEIPDFDFHDALAILGDYPTLLRRLGLAIDLAIDAEVPAVDEMRVIPHWGTDQPASGFATDLTPWTRYATGPDHFVARALDASRLADGMVALDGASDDFEQAGSSSRYGLVQVDPDGAALRTVAMAVNLRSLVADVEQQRAAFDTPERTGLGPMRSVGIGVFAKDRAAAVHADLAGAAARNATADLSELVHSAEDLVRGYRVDVFDPDGAGGGTWRSLCERTGSYRIHRPVGSPIEVTEDDGTPIVDEGYIKAVSTTSEDDGASDLYLHETMFRWDGWSLVCERPGRTIVPEPSPDRLRQDEEVRLPEPELATEFGLQTSFEPVQGSLPQLRFGREYRFRVRAVDLAGNSLDADVSDDAHASAALFFGRFDPINPPSLVPRQELTEGESVERMVIRSTHDRTVDDYAAATGYAPVNDRHVVPPKTSQEMAERHGAFDTAFGPGGDPAAAYAVAIREAATLAHTHVQVPGSDPIAYEPLSGSVMVPGDLPPDAPDGTQAQGAYLINTEERFPLAYLPDVLARGAAFRGLPGTDDTELREFAGDWPDHAPFVLRIVESPGTVKDSVCAEVLDEDPKPPSWDADGRVLTVFLPKATLARVRYSCYPASLEQLAVWRRWMAGVVDERLVAAGGHWMITPFRELVLVHAVQKPLCAPAVRLEAWRQTGETFARLQGMVHLSVRSTGQLDLSARWDEPIDSLSEVGPTTAPGYGHVSALRVDDNLPEPHPFPPATPLPDGTMSVPYTAGLPLPLPDIASLPEPYQVTDPEAEGYFEPHELVEFRRDDIKHEFGDTRHRWVRYHLTGTTRFREYFPPQVTGDPAEITRTGDEILVNVPSSARPDAPRVKYIVPSWKWEQDPAEGARWTRFRRRRVGGGLRVWMDRPWYSSGEGEQLAVVLWRGVQPPSENQAKRVSGFGMDPAWSSAIPSATLRATDFGNAAWVGQNLVLAEEPKGLSKVDIVAFEPEYDSAARRLWFCDIDLSRKAATSYYPFVRLALARYQRHSIYAAELSPVIQTDFHQLVPSRTLTLTFTGRRQLDVALWGPAPSGPMRNRVEVLLEHHDGVIPGDLGWKPAPGWSKPLRLSDGTPDASWVPPKIPFGLVQATELRARAESQPPPASKISRSSLPTISASEVAAMFDLKSAVIAEIRELPIFVLPGHELWSGSVTLPSDPTIRPLRLVIREFEHFEADPEVGRSHGGGHILDRVVYADIVELPASD